MEILPTQLAELICTRISHDLAGSIGALNNMLEMLAETDGAIEAEDRQLMETAAAALSARQQFFRIAFGLDTNVVENERLQQICDDYLHSVGNRTYPLTFECNNMSAQMAKILCLCLMLSAEICMRGGHIRIKVGRKVNVEVASDNALAEAKIKIYEQILSGKLPQENAGQYAHLIYLRAFLGQEVPFKLTSSDNAMNLVIG